MKIPLAIFEEMRAWAQTCLPEEACGILGGCGETVRRSIAVENELHSPERFRMNGEQQWRAFQALAAAGLELVGIWHSHPRGPAAPSPTDLAEAFYPAAALLLWAPDAHGGWQLRAFRVRGAEAQEEEIRLV